MASITRRLFSAAAAVELVAAPLRAQAKGEARPNILWITCEDIGPQLGCYGDAYSTTPNLDRLAAGGMKYNHAWSNAPVCAPARTTIISGMYPPSTGAEHMRSLTSLPEPMKMFPCYLRDTGYYTSNNSKEDYNLNYTGTVWDESSAKAHWRNRGADQPFFSVFNFTITHESQIRTRPHDWIHDPAKARVPAYHPDTPEVRKDWAQYYDNISTMDGMAAKVLAQLSEDGLADDTVVMFYGDHGSGMPRSKRWPYNSGLRVPMIVHFPKRFAHLAPKEYRAGGTSNRLVSFVDLAPSVLSLAGRKAPSHMQGHAFLGAHTAPEQPFVYGFRGRMDERTDFVRSVRDRRYVYLRQYMPHRIYGQHVGYMFQTPTTQVWKKLYDEGKLNEAQKHFWEPKPAEELYDLQNDRDEVNNLASRPEHQATLKRLREAQQRLARNIRDVGFLPEGEIHERAKNSTPYEMGHDEAKYAMPRIMGVAEMASSMQTGVTAHLGTAMTDADSAVRYWAALGVLMRGEGAVTATHGALLKALADPSPYVRIVVAEALGRFGAEGDLRGAVATLLELAPADKNGAYVSLAALAALDSIGPRVAVSKETLKAIPTSDPSTVQRAREYPQRVMEKLLKERG